MSISEKIDKLFHGGASNTCRASGNPLHMNSCNLTLMISQPRVLRFLHKFTLCNALWMKFTKGTKITLQILFICH